MKTNIENFIGEVYKELHQVFSPEYFIHEFSKSEDYHYIVVLDKETFDSERFIELSWMLQNKAYEEGINNFGFALATKMEMELFKKKQESQIIPPLSNDFNLSIYIDNNFSCVYVISEDEQEIANTIIQKYSMDIQVQEIQTAPTGHFFVNLEKAYNLDDCNYSYGMAA